MGVETRFGTARIAQCMHRITRKMATFAAIVRALLVALFASQLYIRFGVAVSRMVHNFQREVRNRFLNTKKPKKKKKISSNIPKWVFRVRVRANFTSSSSDTPSRWRRFGPSCKKSLKISWWASFSMNSVSSIGLPWASSDSYRYPRKASTTVIPNKVAKRRCHHECVCHARSIPRDPCLKWSCTSIVLKYLKNSSIICAGVERSCCRK